MRKSFKYLSILVLIFSSIESFAQKPMNIELLNSKVDSIISEANEIYDFFNAKMTAEKIANERFNLDYKWILEIKEEDSIRIKFLNAQKTVIAKMTFYNHSKNPIIKNNLKDKLSNYEDSLFQIKHIFLSKISTSEFGIESHDSEKVITLIFPYENNFKIYRILSTEKKNTIPFGNDFLFIVNKEGRIQHWKSYHKSYAPMKTVLRGNNVRHIIPKYNDNETYILTLDIVLFRFYANNKELNTLTAYPPKSKRYFTYNSKSNKLRIHSSPAN